MLKKFLFLLFVLILVSTVNAEQTLGYKKFNSEINLIQTCNSSYSNITRIVYPNSSFALDSHVSMTKKGDNYNYTFNLTNQYGVYYVYGICDHNGIKTFWQYDFKINKTGYELTNQQVYIILFMVSFLFLISLLLFIYSIKTEFPIIKIFSISLSIILIVFLVGYVDNISNNFIGEYNDLTTAFTPLYITFVTLLIGGGIGLMLYLIYYSFNMFYKYRGLKVE